MFEKKIVKKVCEKIWNLGTIASVKGKTIGFFKNLLSVKGEWWKIMNLNLTKNLIIKCHGRRKKLKNMQKC